MTASMAPRVSVIVPVYNGASEIGRCLDAVLAQDFSDYEVVVVDNGSTDGTGDLVAKRPVTVVREDDTPGSYAARNRGIEAAHGDLIAFTDADCAPAPDWLSRLVPLFDDAHLHVAGGEVEAAPADNEVAAYMAARGFLSHRHTMTHPFRPYLQTANVMYRRAVFDAVGPFTPELLSGGDADMSWRAQEAGLGPIRFVPEARVLHHHRTDVPGLVTQRYKWGLGAGCLARLWGPKMGTTGLGIALGAALRVAGAVARWLVALPGGAFGGAEGRRRLRWAGWEVSGTVAWLKGYLTGRFHPAKARGRRL
jgi:cellulose synthase/poly-beta-1,6-N-acetylglucosamine synthase-like glycosyltransferase